jgi:esterase/lipase
VDDSAAQILAKNIWELQQMIRTGQATARGRQMLLRAHADQVAYLEEKLGIETEHRAFILERDDSRDGVLLVHGSTGTPDDLQALAQHLHTGGYNVYCMRLPGHGVPGAPAEGGSWQACRAEVQARYRLLSDCCKNVFVVGYSFGATLTLQLDVQPRPRGLVLLAPALFPRLGWWQRLLLSLGLERLAFVRRKLGWGAEILEAMAEARRQKWWNGTPVFAAMCKDDDKVDTRSLSFVRSRITHHRSLIREHDSGGHLFHRGDLQEETHRSVLEFIKEN